MLVTRDMLDRIHMAAVWCANHASCFVVAKKDESRKP